jgi:hypothetical protein
MYILFDIIVILLTVFTIGVISILGIGWIFSEIQRQRDKEQFELEKEEDERRRSVDKYGNEHILMYGHGGEALDHIECKSRV